MASLLRETAAKKEADDYGIRTSYGVIDSPLYGNDIPDFNSYFKCVLPEDQQDLGKYVIALLKGANRYGEALGIEFGGQGNRLFHDFRKLTGSWISHGAFKRSFGVALGEFKEKKSLLFRPPNHRFIPGDVFEDKTYENLEKEIGEEKFDFIMERMLLGLSGIPPEPFLVSGVLSRWYSMLRIGGVMFIEVPNNLATLIEPWVEMLKREHSDKLEVQAFVGTGSISNARLRIRKLSDEKLPLLSVREVRKISKE